jgi:transposase-like protein
LRAKAESKNFGFAIELDEPACLSCGAKQLIKSGLRKNKYGDVQRYKCQSCGFRFTVNLGFQKMKNSPKIITLIMDLYVKGISTRKIVQHLHDFYDLKVDHSTIVRYVQKYTQIIKEFVDEAVTPNLKNTIFHMDETLVNVKNTEKMGKGFYSYAWTVMDSHTRFLLACEISKHRTASDGVRTLQKAQDLAGCKPMAVITDSYQGYSQIVKDVFYTREKPRPIHIQTKAIAHGMDNVRIERQFGELKDRTKVMRGLGNDKGAQTYADLHRINHNFVKPHMSLNNKTPAQVAGINLPLGENKWLDLIKISALNNKTNKHKSSQNV